MPVRVPDLPLFGGNLTNHQLLVMDANFDLHRYTAADFRGAGLFTGADAPPTEVHPQFGINQATYMDGDQYISVLGTSRVLYTWEQSQVEGSRWINNGSLIGTRRLTVENFPDTTFENTRDAAQVVTDADFGVGDTFYNATLNKTFGPYLGSNVMNFDPSAWPIAYISDRASTRHTEEPVGDGSMDHRLHTWTPNDLTDDTLPAYFPQRGDSFFQRTDISQAEVDGNITDAVEATQSPEHGGYIHHWDQDTYENLRVGGQDHLTARMQAWTSIPKTFARAPRTFLASEAPTVDDEKYIDGDSFHDQVSGQLFSDYRTAATADRTGLTGAALLRFVWGDTDPVATDATTIHSLASRTRDDAAYKVGDFGWLQGEAIMYGPYVSGQATHEEAWPFNSSSAAYSTFIPDPSSAPVDVPAVYFAEANPLFGGALALGDRIVQTLVTAVNPPRPVQTRTVTYICTALAAGNATWVLLDQEHAPRIYNDPNLFDTDITRYPYPMQDDVRFIDGDTFMFSGITFGPYVSGAVDTLTAWPIHTIGSPVEHRISLNYGDAIPATDADWNPALRDGDTVVVDILNSTNGMQLEYDVVHPLAPAAIVRSDAWTFENPRPTRGTTTHFQNTAGVPVRIDGNYAAGDFIKNAQGSLYGPYVPEAVDDPTGWPLLSTFALTDLFVTDDTTGLVYKLGIDNAVPYWEEQA